MKTKKVALICGILLTLCLSLVACKKNTGSEDYKDTESLQTEYNVDDDATYLKNENESVGNTVELEDEKDSSISEGKDQNDDSSVIKDE